MARTALVTRYHLRGLYQNALRLLGNPEDAEEVLQDGLLSAFKNLHRFEARSRFSTWLTRLVINAALMRLRKLRGRRAAGDSWEELRLCLVCGHNGCCDSSKNKHATKHFQATGHPIIGSFQPREGWIWCTVDQSFV